MIGHSYSREEILASYNHDVGGAKYAIGMTLEKIAVLQGRIENGEVNELYPLPGQIEGWKEVLARDEQRLDAYMEARAVHMVTGKYVNIWDFENRVRIDEEVWALENNNAKE